MRNKGVVACGGFPVSNHNRHRQLDSQRLIQRNKNLKACDATVRKATESGLSAYHQADLYKKQHLEFQRAEAAIRSIMPAAWGACVLLVAVGTRSSWIKVSAGARTKTAGRA